MQLLITGGCGYVGSVLVPHLLAQDHQVRVVDTQWFGNHLPTHPRLTLVKGDIRDIGATDFMGVDAIIHLANIANDPGVDLNPTLSWEVNVLASQQLATLAVRAGVSQFIYASSGSVYGIKEEKQVTEDLELLPISTYNKTKMVAERVLLSYAGEMAIHNIRPATVCGLSPRMRLDVSVNMLSFQALANHNITVFGGDQVRPNIHIRDMARVYEHFLNHPDLPSGNYNAGFENISIQQLAEMIACKTGASITTTPSNDPRSYRQNSDKLLNTGFKPMFSVDHAVDELSHAFAAGELVDSEQSHTVKWMTSLGLASG
jgi:nucleoside-diphosphate-sugar epimerase